MSVVGAAGSDRLIEVAIGDDFTASMPGSWSGDPVLFEPGEHLGPAVLRFRKGRAWRATPFELEVPIGADRNPW
jgi:hypothetical protein